MHGARPHHQPGPQWSTPDSPPWAAVDTPYPYLSLWRLRFTNGTYRAVYAGPFLHGTLHAVRAFGTTPGRKAVFVKHPSRLECEPIVYLTALDFDAGADAQAYDFTYAESHRDFAPAIEYELPGMGHTVEASVETRVLPPSAKGPHLLQFFDMADGEGPDEWWAFTCTNYRCDYQIFQTRPPMWFSQPEEGHSQRSISASRRHLAAHE